MNDLNNHPDVNMARAFMAIGVVIALFAVVFLVGVGVGAWLYSIYI